MAIEFLFGDDGKLWKWIVVILHDSVNVLMPLIVHLKKLKCSVLCCAFLLTTK